MAVLSNTGIRAGASIVTDTDPYRVKRSARFNNGDSSYLNWTPEAAGNRKTWTWSGWVKRSVTGTNDDMFKVNGAAAVATNLQLMFHNSDFISVDYGGAYYLKTNALYRDVSAWYHIVLAVDTTQATDTNRMKLYVNGSQVTSFDQTNYPTQNDDLAINSAAEHLIGGPNYFDGYIADIHFIDGTAKAPTDFAETDSTTGQWVPKKYTGSHGTNGFHLAMDPANSDKYYSDDITGDGGYAAYTNFATNARRAFDGSLTTSCWADSSTSSGSAGVLTWTPPTPISISSLKIYGTYHGSGDFKINGSSITSQLTQGASSSWFTITGISTLTNLSIHATSGSDTAHIRAIEINGEVLTDHGPIGHDSSGNNNHWHENNLFGYEHTTASENFKAVTYEGNSGTQTISGLGFSPGLVWIKQTNATASHFIYDTVRGTQKLISSNYDGPENWAGGGGTAGELTAFTSDGFTLVNSGSYGGNVSGGDFVAWCWKAGGAASSNSDGSITSSVSANTTAGFSIVSYEGTGPSSSGTVGHGLGKKPDMIIAKSRDATTNWYVWHSSSASNINTKYALLNTTDKVNQSAGNLFATVGTTTFGVEAGSNTNNQDSMIAYCFTEIEGYSKFGHYIGNNNATGPIIDCGFTPAFVLFRRVDDDNNWQIFDNARSLDNDLKPNTAEAEGSAPIEFQPNGFQIKNTYTSTNASGGEYIYMAIAGTPGGDLDLLADAPGAPYDNELNGGGNYPTMNSLVLDGLVLSNGNLNVTNTGSNTWSNTRSTMAVQPGEKCYCEVKINAATASGNGAIVELGAIIDNPKDAVADYLGKTDTSWYWQNNGGNCLGHNNTYTTYGGSSITYETGDIIGIAIDLSAGTLKYYKNGVDQGTAFTSLPTDTPVMFACALYNDSDIDWNFGQRTFAYTPPAGYKSLNTYNLSDPTITKGNTGFDTTLWNGTGSAQTVSLEFNPDMVWSKTRSHAVNHKLADSVRGFGNTLEPDQVIAEYADAQSITATSDSGFTLGTGNDWNNGSGGRTYVGWAWDAGTANVSKDADNTWHSAMSNSSTAANLFDGSTTSFYGPDGNTQTFTPSPAITVNTKLEIFYKSASTSRDFEVNDSGTTIATGTSASGKWVDLNFTGSLTKISGTNGWNVAAIRIDDQILTDASLASTYRVNTNTGFSVVSYTGVGNTVSSVAHGLNAKPDLILVKDRDAANDWAVYHSALGNTKDLCLNDTGAESTRLMWNDTSPTSSAFTIGAGNNADYRNRVNDTNDYIAYCWSEVAGYSKIGSWLSTGNSFVYCGFKPKFLLAKCTSHTGDWMLYDTERGPLNQDADNNTLVANVSNAEDGHYNANQASVDLLSNGFKIRHGPSSSPLGDSGRTYVFAAFAESPFKYSNAR